MTTITRDTKPSDAADLLNFCDMMPQGIAALARELARRGLLGQQRQRLLSIAGAALEMALEFLPASAGIGAAQAPLAADRRGATPKWSAIH